MKKEKNENNINYSIKDLINNKNELDLKLKELIESLKFALNKDDKDKIENEIKAILEIYNKSLESYQNPIQKYETLTIYDQNKDLMKDDYVGFVYYFWSASTMNFKIIGLKNFYPIFDLINTQEKYYLDKPTMITNDIPIYWIQKGIPFTIETRIKKQLLELNQEVFENGYNADLISAMSKSSHWINVYGKEKWTFKFISFLLTIILCVCLIEYIVLSNILVSE